jgi:hypothetical protein
MRDGDGHGCAMRYAQRRVLLEVRQHLPARETLPRICIPLYLLPGFTLICTVCFACNMQQLACALVLSFMPSGTADRAGVPGGARQPVSAVHRPVAGHLHRLLHSRICARIHLSCGDQEDPFQAGIRVPMRHLRIVSVLFAITE